MGLGYAPAFACYVGVAGFLVGCAEWVSGMPRCGRGVVMRRVVFVLGLVAVTVGLVASPVSAGDLDRLHGSGVADPLDICDGWGDNWERPGIRVTLSYDNVFGGWDVGGGRLTWGQELCGWWPAHVVEHTCWFSYGQTVTDIRGEVHPRVDCYGLSFLYSYPARSPVLGPRTLERVDWQRVTFTRDYSEGGPGSLDVLCGIRYNTIATHPCFQQRSAFFIET